MAGCSANCRGAVARGLVFTSVARWARAASICSGRVSSREVWRHRAHSPQMSPGAGGWRQLSAIPIITARVVLPMPSGPVSTRVRCRRFSRPSAASARSCSTASWLPMNSFHIGGLADAGGNFVHAALGADEAAALRLAGGNFAVGPRHPPKEGHTLGFKAPGGGQFASPLQTHDGIEVEDQGEVGLQVGAEKAVEVADGG